MENNEKNQIKQIEELLRTSTVKSRSISTELRSSFMEYAMSVIVSRALPDARDGLKPVHRRALYAASELGMTHDRPYKKAARLVGEIIGKYHPHGDVAVYETIVRMAQDFSMRYPLIDGHGNFGSIDGDSAAAMRYTEVRMSKIALEMLRDIKKNTVDFVDNYDGSENEPIVLPAYIPNLLVNGSSGIAVGMATNIPPHNFAEIVDGIVMLANNCDVSNEKLFDVIKGPDFPTGAEIIGKRGIIDYFSTGRGCVVVRSKISIEKNEGKHRLVVTEIPYEVKKTAIIERIVELVNTGQLHGICNIRDESSRHGIRLVIDVKKDVLPEVLMNHLYKHTQLQTNFNVNMLALVDNEPKLLNLKQLLQVYLNHQVVVLTRKYEFELEKNKSRVHLIEGLLKAVENIKRIVQIINDSASTDEALQNLISEYGFSKIQAQAVIEMRLRVLIGLERKKLQQELSELQKIIEHVEKVLGSYDLKLKVIIDNLLALKEIFSDERRTLVSLDAVSEIDDESLIPVEDIVVTMSRNGYLKRISIENYRLQNRGGVGVTGVSTYSDDEIEKILIASTHTDLLFFTNRGKVFKIRGYMIPVASKIAKGTPAVNLLQIDKDEKILSILPISEYSGSILIATTLGIIKRMHLSELEHVRANGKIAINLRDNDSLYDACVSNEISEIFIGTYSGKVVRFLESDVRLMGRSASGVTAVKLNGSNDRVVGLSTSNDGNRLLTISELGYGKITPIDRYRLTKRSAAGTKTMNITAKTGQVISTLVVKGDEDLLLLTLKGKIIRISLSDFHDIGRCTSGVKLINLKQQNKIVSAAVFKNSKKIEINKSEELPEKNNDDVI